MPIKISQLPETNVSQSTDIFPIVQGGQTKGIRKDVLFSGIDGQIENLSNNKVNKSGDTLTGELQFNNKNEYGAIKKTRTLSNVDYSAYLGVGGNVSSRLELLDSNNNVLSSVEVRPDGYIWNGVKNRRLVERARQTWGSSLSFTMEAGNQAIAMLDNTDMMMLWVGGVPGSETLNTVRLYGTNAQATFDRTTMTVTLKYNDNRNFTANVIIS